METTNILLGREVDGFRVFVRKEAGINKWGLAKSDGNPIESELYDETGSPSEGLLNVRKGKHWGVVNRKNEQVAPFIYESIGYYNDGRAVFQRDGRQGYLDVQGVEVLSPLYRNVKVYSNGIATVSHEDTHDYDYLDSFGKTIIARSTNIHIWARCAPRFKDNRLPIYKNGAWGFIDPIGHQVIEPIFNGVYTFNDGTAEVVLPKDLFKNCYGTSYIDINGEFFTRSQYSGTYRFIGGFAPVWWWDEGLSIVNLSGKHSRPRKGWRADGPFCQGRARAVYKLHEAGFFDKNGDNVIGPVYEYADDFSPVGMAVVRINGKYGYIDVDGNIVIEAKYDLAESFSEFGIAEVKSVGQNLFINELGKEL